MTAATPIRVREPSRVWEFWIDRGGTFTDVIGIAPDGALHTAKLLSSESAPGEGIRDILARASGLGSDAPLPECVVKLGTTVATNALLERRGVRTALLTHEGLGDVFRIRTQERPELFDLAIRTPAPLHERVLPARGRRGQGGEVVCDEDGEALRRALDDARRDGAESVAAVALHAEQDPDLEIRWAALARDAGFSDVTLSHEIAREQGFLARGETAIADAYLTPLLRRHTETLRAELPGSRLRFMQSSGGLTDASRFRGPFALLSGPAGGVVGAAEVAQRCGYERALGFDMGGTSTDVSLILGGEVDRGFETEVAGIRVRAPMLRIHTVAAGGGSLCRFDGFRLSVGPESAGADPGPLCYGRARDDGELALTDVNLFLGRLQSDRFPFALDVAPVRAAMGRTCDALAAAGHAFDLDQLAAGFIEIANASMAQAIQEVSVARGVDPRECVLVGFGGAGAQHVCAVARSLGIRSVLLHPLAGLLSAYGIGMAPLTWDRQRDAGRVPLEAGPLPRELEGHFEALEYEGRAALTHEGATAAQVECERILELRYAGTETAIAVPAPGDAGWRRAFEREHRTRFGYVRPGRVIEIVTLRVRARAPSGASPPAAAPPPATRAAPAPHRSAEAWFPELGRVTAPVYEREALFPGDVLEGPAIVLEDTGTVVIDPGFRAEVREELILELRDIGAARATRPRELDAADPIRLEVFGNRVMSVAEQMGAVLRNTSVSTNIKERLDYSCAVFDGEGGLVANAPHIPVHLGAMGETVRSLRAAFPTPVPGDVWVTNDPFSGGSHLPDVTVVTPVFAPGDETPSFFVGSRGHHADLGGSTPGSMPADSTRLEEEGVVIAPMRLVHAGHFDEAGVRETLGAGPYPARNPDDNVADLEAMVAANRAGAELLLDWHREVGADALRVTMRELQAAAADKVAGEIAKLADGEHHFSDALDDGTPIAVTLLVEGARMRIDFEGTGAALRGNLNAPRAVVRAAVIYVLRSLVAERIPLNGGCLHPVEIVIPPGSLLDPPPGSAVVGGNVETSQRVVDVLLGALGIAAASQGTMNNVTFGNAGFGYYETIGGGAGAGPDFPGASGVHVHMTNTRITDPEVLESRYPVRLLEFSLRRGSGGAGRQRGGDGLVRRYEFLEPVSVTLLTERRSRAPFGLAGGESGAPGSNRVLRAGARAPGALDADPGAWEEVAAKVNLQLDAGDELRIETPGGGGFGKP